MRSIERPNKATRETIAMFEAALADPTTAWSEADIVRETYRDDPTVSNEEFGQMVEDADRGDRAREAEAEAVTHAAYGEGEITDVYAHEVVVRFQDHERRYPRSSIVDGRIVLTHEED